jgi:putative DNA primase/helicase
MNRFEMTAPAVPYPYESFVRALHGAPKAPRGQARTFDEDGTLIEQGSRNSALASMAGSMRRDGADRAEIALALHQHNALKCHPALDKTEVERIASSISRYAPGGADSSGSNLTDTGNADRLARDVGEVVRYVPEMRQWIIWNGERWERDGMGQIIEFAKATALRINAEVGDVSHSHTLLDIVRHARNSQQIARLQAMVELAKSIPSIIVRATDLDKDPFLLGLKNGTLNLRTGKLRAADKADLITQQAPIQFDPEAKCPEFERFLATVMRGDQELVDYIQRMMGYCLTGRTEEQCFFFLHGSGSNGKSTFLNVLGQLLGGDLYRQVGSDSLMVRKNGGGATNDLARLTGARVVMSNEVQEGDRLNESLIKDLTGGESIAARFLYAEFFEYTPKFKILFAGNHQPVIRGDDTGIWRRLRLIPFTHTIGDGQKDVKLPEKLRAELPGILNFALAGCLEWQREGLVMPKSMVAAGALYRSDMDVLGQWVAERCALDNGLEIKASAAYTDYKGWATLNGFRPLSSNSFSRRLRERYLRTDRRDGAYYQGLSIKDLQ